MVFIYRPFLYFERRLSIINIGISSACLFPMLTEKSLELLLKNGVKNLELFLNSPSESNPNFIKTLLPLLNEFDAKICSVHPCTSEFEGVSFFGRYERRFTDSLENYNRLFEVCSMLNCNKLIFHGARSRYKISDGLYFERFGKLCEKAKTYNVYVCQENVVDFYSQSPTFIEKLVSQLPDIKTVLDIKQCIRASVDPFEMLKSMKSSLFHVHLSDNDAVNSCMIPGKGNFNFPLFFNQLKSTNYNGDIVIELYSDNFSDINELIKSKEYINDILCKV